ncbi:MAG: permease-like cell division protein FtsX [Candidatus Staskawiczbacteria bacterium]|nr:permease-like cell division protein FtsX [Candidatus Staskawiczbacteria bacterium]
MATKLKRIIDFAFSDFSRNKGISIAAVFVLVVTMMLVTGLIFFQGMAGYLTSQIRDKIDITAYFVDGTAEQDILGVKDQILKMSPNIKNVEYVSQEQALASFNEKHKDNPVLSKAVQEVGENPFLPSLNITTNGDPAQYEEVSNILQTSDFNKLIDKVDFSQKKDTIEKVYSITSNINTFGIILGAILILVAILVVFNTIKLAIENSKEEISTMRIVGASDWFVRGPFLIQGIIYGVIAFIVCIIASGLVALLLSSKISAVLPGFNMFSYFLTNLWILVLIQLGFGVGVGIISSFIVVKKYLDI